MLDPNLAPIQIYTFGTLQVIRHGEAVNESDWRTRQARQLLKILITERPRPVSTDRLIEILWPDSTPDAAATTLRSAVNALRNVLEPDRPNRAPSVYIHTQTPGYAFRLHPDIWLDVDVFGRWLDDVTHTATPTTRRHLLENSIALYQDDYLIGDPYADWAKSERERLRERYFDALLNLAALQARRATIRWRFQPVARCWRVTKYARTPIKRSCVIRPNLATAPARLLTYERCRVVLGEQLGADPSPLTQQLHGRILNGEVETTPAAALSAHAARDESLPTSSSDSLPQQSLLPALEAHPHEPFVGRDQEMAELAAALQRALDRAGSLVVLGGEMGVGKSRLAYEVLRRAETAGATVISATCQRLEQNLPYAPITDAIGRYLQLLPDSSLRRLPRAALHQIAQILPSLHDRLSDLPASLEGHLSPEENRQRLIEGIVSFLTGLADLRPLVLLFDDLHWADAETLAVLSRLSKSVGRAPFLLLLTYRHGDLVENEALQTLLHALRRTPHAAMLTVERLGLDDVAPSSNR